MKSLFIVLVILMLGTVACTSNDDAVNALQQQIDTMKQEIKALEADHAKQITALVADNDQLKSSLEKLGTRDSRLSTQISNLENQPNLEECLVELFSYYKYKPMADGFDYDTNHMNYLTMSEPHFIIIGHNNNQFIPLRKTVGLVEDWVESHRHAVTLLAALPPECES